MQGQKGPSFSRSIGWTRRLHNFASPRRKLHDGATCPPPQQSGRTGRAPGFEAQTVIPVCLVVLKSKSPKPSISAWLTHDHLDIDACPVFAYLTRPTPSSSIHILLLFSVPCGSSVTPSGLLNLSVQAYSCSSFTTLDPSARTFRSTFTASVDRHVASCA